MKKPEFTADGNASADIVIVGSGIVGGMMADQLVSQGYSVLVLEAGLRIERAQAVENWRNMPFDNRAGTE
jgi:choline dehydrogenase-like flavoprotein